MSVKKNFLYSSVLTISNYLFPLLTYPYVSRILGVENIGICNFVDSIISYYVLFSSLGISMVGIREISGARNDKKELDSRFSSLILFNLITTCIAVVVLIISIYVIPRFYEFKELMWIGVVKLVGNFLLIDWFFKGIENFKYITNRTILVKLGYVISVFVLVKEPSDYCTYFLLTCLMIAVNSLFNLLYSRKFVSINVKQIELKRLIKPMLTIGFYNILTSMYTTFNVMYLGLVSTSREVGYYTTATKLHSIILAFFTAFTGVMIPRMSFLFSEGDMENFKQMIGKSLNALFAFIFPVLCMTIIFVPDIISVLSGPGYEGAFLPARIIMPLLLVIGVNQISILQVMTPMKADKYISRNSFIGALVGVIMNVTIVPYLGSVGSSIVWLCSELVIFAASLICVNKLIGFVLPLKNLLKYVLGYSPLLGICIMVYYCVDAVPIIRLCIVCGITLIYTYYLQFYIIKDEFVLSVINKIYK